jgi:polar amino acid transport system substrate-binding protein
MAVVCALVALCALLLPLTAGPSGTTAGQSARTGSPEGAGGTAWAVQADAGAEVCAKGEKDPQDLSLPPSSATGATVAAIKKRGYLSVGVDQNSYRWGYRDPNSTDGEAPLEGFDIDLAQAIGTAILGPRPDIRYHAVPTNARITAIQGGQVDIVVRTMTITCDRLKQVAFSAPYFLTGQQILASKSSSITGYNDTLDNKKVCSAEDSTALDRLTADRRSGALDSSVNISTQVPNQLDCLVRLQLGQVDAVMTDGALAASQAAQDPTVELKGDPLTPEYYGVAMARDAGDLEQRINQVLADYRKGAWQDSYTKWLSATLGADSDSAKPPEPHYR